MNESYSINRRNPIIAQPKSDVRPLDRSVAETKAPALKELFGFDDDIVELESSIEVTLSTTTVSSKSALTKKRESFKRFLKNPKPMVSSTTSPSKRKTPSKIGKSVEIFGGATNAQKDIRDAFQSNTHHMTVDDGPNLFSDTETEIVGFICIVAKIVRNLHRLFCTVFCCTFSHRIAARATHERVYNTSDNWLPIQSLKMMRRMRPKSMLRRPKSPKANHARKWWIQKKNQP